MPPSLESSLALAEPPALKQKSLILDVPIVRQPPVRSSGKAREARTYGDEPLPVMPSEVAPQNGRITGRVAKLGKIPNYTLKIGETEIKDVKLWEILDYVSPLELERYENQQFKEEAEALDIARAAAAAEKERRRARQAEKARQKGVIIFQDVDSDDLDSTDADDADGRRGRARPNYTHLFKVPSGRRRRRKRDPVTNELMDLSDEDVSDAAQATSAEPPKGRRRKRDPITGELMPLSDRREDDGVAVEPQRRRRRKRDPITGDLMPLSDHESDVPMSMSGGDGLSSMGQSPAPTSTEVPKRRRRKRDPVTGKLLPLEPIPQPAMSDAPKIDHRKLPRRRRHPQTGVLMPLGWKYNPNEKKSPVKSKDLMSPAMRKMSISQEHSSKRIKLASESSGEVSQTRQTPGSSTQMPFRGSPGKQQPMTHPRQTTIDLSDTDELADDDAMHRPASASKSQATPKTSILHPTGPAKTMDDSSDSSAEQITLASFLKTSGQHIDSDDDSDSSKPEVKHSQGTPRTSIMNPVASQQIAEEEDEDEEELDADEWYVEAIVGHRMSDPKSHPGRKQVILYQTKWEGSSELTWEPFESFDDPSTVSEYRKRVGLDKPVASSSASQQPAQVPQSSIGQAAKAVAPTTAEQKQDSSEEDSEEEDEDDEEEGWEVEEVLAHHMSDPRTHPGKPQTMLYKVKWVGWKDHTWEPITSFPDKAVVNAYRRKAGLIPV